MRSGTLSFSKVLLSLAAFLALSGQDVPPQAARSERGAKKAFTFAWPVPCQVRVTERAVKAGKEAVIRYTVDLSREEGSENLLLRIIDYEFLELDGKDMTTATARKALAPITALSSAIPNLRISQRGELLELVGYEEMIERITQYGTVARMEERKVAQLRESMLQPRVRKMVEASASDFWENWVGFWATLDNLAPGRPVQLKVPLSDAAPDEMRHVRADHLGPATGVPGHVRLRAVSRANAKSTITSLLAQTGMAPNERELAKLKSCEIQSHVELITDPKTLMPRRVEFQKTIRIEVEGEEDREREERHEYEFDWSGVAKGKKTK